ncbi:hypothetical protein [Pseudoxanthomonas sp. GW2]|uniref:hypothetical protein n=1 Tax=Pseudoxanthomonas sp. GW2 TaxID=1211114 RepID=UPI0002DEF59F|nr:hypothetical protein [Pseudoxanthomonas sp. GW2]
MAGVDRAVLDRRAPAAQASTITAAPPSPNSAAVSVSFQSSPADGTSPATSNTRR